MKVEPAQFQRPLERPTLGDPGAGPFEETLDLAATLRLSKASQRAFTFDERGVLSLSPSGAAATSDAAKEQVGVDGPVTLAAPPYLRRIEPETDGADQIGRIAKTIGASVTLPSASLPPTVQMPVLPSPDVSLTVASNEPMRATGTPQTTGIPATGGSRWRPHATPAANNTTLTIAWTADGLVVYAAAPALRVDEIQRLRQQAEVLAESRGVRLSDFILNGTAIALPPLPRRP